eukprot:CAMPEP_0170427100 /NCGR_PEP_ID=MMETSP0117_2-20130122/39032_1 /TAXON_ID=400756 /ORGANISM="Durinskia baltica, Strain CSIRO CS-38" /LENGTH=139 /DNA_ID=CAMNT_0010686255 /DNA_START=967 /DNA_END=1387 /DNA_ORIENTATION=+
MTLVEQLQNPAGEFGLLSQEQQRAKLLELHPACRELDDLGAAEDNCPGLPALSGEDVLLTMVVSALIAPPGGLDGPTDLLSVLWLAQPSITTALGCFYGWWMAGALGQRAADLFAVGRAVLIPREGGGLRPLGIGEAWY